MLGTMLGLIVLLCAMYLWQNALHARDLARTRAHALCVDQGLQLLDQTVSLAGVRVSRNAQSHLRMLRTYRFEVSIDGHDRHRGSLQMQDGRILSWSLPSQTESDTAVITPASGSNVIAIQRDNPSRPH